MGLTGGSLCSGSGGLDLGLERALDIEWLWHCETDDAAAQIHAAHWPGLPNHGDLLTTDWTTVAPVELVAAGFPCPDYSLAGKRKGIDGEHGQVWHGVAAALRTLRPRFVVLENVDAIRTAPGPVDGAPGESALGVVLSDLADLGYRWAYDRIRAADVGAPHGRLRWFCVAVSSAADAVGAGIDADRVLRGRGAGTSGPGGSASSAVAAGPEMDGAADALTDGAGAREADGVALLPTPSAWLGRRPENSMADPERAASREHAGKRGKRSIELPDALAAEVTLLPTPVGSDGRGLTDGDSREGGASLREVDRLLPTPVVTDSFGSRRSTARTDDWKSNPGTSLTDAIWETQGRDTDTRGAPLPRLLPTPQAADGDGGRQEKGAMANAGVRPSGQKATLPLPTAVAMRDELTDTPFARETDDDDGQMALLPTPVANDANPGAGGELRAAIVHGEGRRNETGIDTLGRPNDGRPSRPVLLPTPTTGESVTGHGRRGGKPGNGSQSGAELDAVAERLLPTDPQLLPTPRVTSERNSRKAMVENQQWSSVSLAQAAEIADGVLPREFASWDEVPGAIGRDARARRADPLLPTPTSQLEHDSQTHRSGERGDELLLGGIAKAHAEVQWGVYEAAVRRWEHVLDRPAPAPTDDKGRLAPEFVCWMLGYPAGWFDIDGVSRTRKLRALGNSVQVQCGEAVGGWFAFLVEAGLLA